MNRRLVGVALVLGIATGLATACTASGSDSATSLPVEGSADGAADSAGTASGADQPRKSGGAERENVDQPGVNRNLVRTANIDLTAADVGKVADGARDIAITQGGYSGQEDVREDTATLTLRIPSDRFDEALGELSKLGTVTRSNQRADDVTEEVVDLDSRIATQRASVDRVRTLLAKATTVDEIVRIEQELTTREADLESLEQRRQALGGEVAMSTVTINVSRSTAPRAVQREEESSGFVAGLSDGWGAFLDAGAVTLQVLGAVLPFLLVLAVPGVPAYRWWRRRRTAAVQGS
jgi:uncharacterized protein DUF4349